MDLRQETQLAHSRQSRHSLYTSTRRTILGVYDRTEQESNSLELNRGLHISYQYSTVNMKQGSDKGERDESDYTWLPQSLSYMEQQMVKQKENHNGQFQNLQGHIGHLMTWIPQAGYTQPHVPFSLLQHLSKPSQYKQAYNMDAVLDSWLAKLYCKEPKQNLPRART